MFEFNAVGAEITIFLAGVDSQEFVVIPNPAQIQMADRRASVDVANWRDGFSASPALNRSKHPAAPFETNRSEMILFGGNGAEREKLESGEEILQY
jgi:hypothetical protein